MRYKGYMRKGTEVYVRDMSSANWELYAGFEDEETAEAFLQKKRSGL